MKTKRSFLDSLGKPWIACCECSKSGNGDKTCSGGFNIKRWNRRGCFSGILLSKFTKIKTWKELRKERGLS